ncbi:MAG: AAA family ATPase [Acidiferrobacteraceae bacterium]
MRRPVLGIIAGPNGSGKSFLKQELAHLPWFHGYRFLNPDELARSLGDQNDPLITLRAAQQAQIQRYAYLAARESFFFETVFSAPEKLDFLSQARIFGYFVRLFFIGTDNPELNAARVARRVLGGGHDVPIPKILSRYRGSMIQAAKAAPQVDRFYLFDNSVDGVAPRLVFWAALGVCKDIAMEPPLWTRPILASVSSLPRQFAVHRALSPKRI